MTLVEVVLPAKSEDDLSWEEELKKARSIKDSGEKILWVFDLGIDPVCCSLTDEAAFVSRALGLSTFSKIYPEFAEATSAIVLAKSSLFRAIDEQDECAMHEHLDEPFKTHLGAMTLFADYLHRLASFLPEEVKMVVLIDGDAEDKSILLSKERFRHIEVQEEDKTATVGCVLPPDGLCDAKTRQELQKTFFGLKQQEISFRCIPEALLNEEWEGLDTLVFLPSATTKLGERMAQGFLAAGGSVLHKI